MEISKKLKQLMKVLLVVLMSLTMIVPDGMAKAENVYLFTDKTVYKYDEAIMVSVKGYDFDSSYVWVGLYKVGDPYEDGSSTRWFQVTDELAWNILDYNKNKTVDPNGGQYEVVLFGDGGYTNVVEKATITILPDIDNDYLFTNKLTYIVGDPIYVTVMDYTIPEGCWVGVYPYDGENNPYGGTSTAWYTLSELGTVNVKDKGTYPSSGEINSTAMDSPGTFKIALFGDSGYNNIIEDVTITIEYSTPYLFQLDYSTAMANPKDKDRIRTFKYGQELTMEFSSPTIGNGAWIGVYPYDGDLGDIDYISYFYLSDVQSPVHYYADTECADIPPGHWRFIMFEDSGYSIAKNSETGSLCIMSFYVVETYYDNAEHIDWTLSEDKTTATAVFHRIDNNEASEPYNTTTVTEIDPIAPTCEEPGYDVYEAVLTLTEDDIYNLRLVTPNDATSFTGEIKVETQESLGHDWVDWTVDVEPTEETEGSGHFVCSRCGNKSSPVPIPVIGHVHTMTHVAAKAPTCTEPGNVEYYHCEKCGKDYEDEAGEKFLEDVSVAALGHDYGKWSYDEEKHNHYKECSRCHDIIEEACTFENSYVGGSVVHTCSVCGGSYEEKFLWTDKQVYKQYEPIITSVDLSAVSNYEGLVVDSAWVGIYPKGEVPAKDMSIRWHYVKNMGEGLDIWAILTYGGEESTDYPGQGSGSTNGRNDYLTTAGDYVIYLLADGGFDKRIGYVTVTLTEETLAADDIKLEFNGKEQEMGQKNEFVLPIDTMNFKVSTENAYGAWVGIYKAEYEKDFDFASITSDWWKYIKDINNNVIDLKDICGEAGKYTLVVYGSGGHNDIRNLIYIEVTKAIVEEKVTVKPTCTEAGNKLVTYSDGTTENVQIPALGHDWSEFKFDGEEAKTHSKECSRCHEKVTEDCTFTAEEKDGVITYTCEVCGGQYTYKKTVADEDVYRTSGPDRYLTALKAAVVFMEKTKKEKLDTVVLACGTNFADALAGSYLAAVKNAPILLIDDNKQATTVENFIKENIVEGGLVYILGGDKAVAPKFESDLKNAGLTVKRLKGDTRYETNIEILKEAGIQGDTILVSVGTNFADSLSASATGLPVLLVKDSLTKVQKDFLKEYKGKKIYILGGTSAVNKTVEGEMGEYGTVKRVQGETRYETSTKIAETFFPETDTVLLAVGDNFPDGLCGGALAYQLHAPVILTKEGNVSFAKKYVARNNITKAVVLGGVNAQKDTLVNDIMGRDPKAEIKEYE